MRGMSPKTRARRPWSWKDVRARTVAIYRSYSEGRERTAVLVWQGDDPRVTVGPTAPRLLVVTVDAEHEAGADNAIAISGFDTLEQARSHGIDWAETAAETSWDSLGEAAQVGVFAAIREPGFVERG
ncbi:MAG TPA: hypothetical protein VHF90_03950 [Thermoleophilaceae bacterium]|nr:hypothetical protein [Thermoleophilaceae bacterium]